MSSLTLGALLLLLQQPWQTAHGARVQVMVTSEWDNLNLRLYLRKSFESCAPRLLAEHSVEHHFFMGSPEGAQAEVAAAQEAQTFHDIVPLGGPDSDTSASGFAGAQGIFKVLQEPAARAVRILRGMAWLLKERADFEYVVQLQDTSFVQLPRLLAQLDAHAHPLLALGRLSTDTPLTYGAGAGNEEPCETCELDPVHERVCIDRTRSVPGGMEFRGCIVAALRCCPGAAAGGRSCSVEELTECVSTAQSTAYPAAVYFGTTVAPRWLHGAAWALGRGVAGFLGENALDLKIRGMPDILMGFWLAGLEDVHFVDLPAELFAAPPVGAGAVAGAGAGAAVSAAAAAAVEEAFAGVDGGCRVEGTAVVGGLSPEHWALHFDVESCEMRCD